MGDALGDTSEATIGLEDRVKVEERLRQLEGKASLKANKGAKAKGKLEKYDAEPASGSYNEAADVTLKSKKKKKKEEGEDGEKKKKKKKKAEEEEEEEEEPK